jgi:hypothetical protein
MRRRISSNIRTPPIPMVVPYFCCSIQSYLILDLVPPVGLHRVCLWVAKIRAALIYDCPRLHGYMYVHRGHRDTDEN